MSFKDSEELQEAGEKLLLLCEQHDRGEISTQQLLKAWKEFTRAGYRYLDELKTQVDHHPDWN